MRFAFTANKKQQEEQYSPPCHPEAAIRGPDYGRSSLIRRTSERVMISARRLAELEKEQEDKKRRESRVGVFDSIVSVTSNINHGIQDALNNASDHVRRRCSNEEDYSISSSHSSHRRRRSTEGSSVSSNGGDSFAGDHHHDSNGALLNDSHHERRERASQTSYNDDDDDDVSEEELQARRGSMMVSW
mmetsp:Transcript_18561/g.28655  ORF Transcript_18561/g.28655 Transcript_18561/m.28655 type:complete len:188 (+) Transcript_18561:106-669(+)